MRVYVTCTVTATVVVYTTAWCQCGTRIIDIPGTTLLEVQLLRSEAQRSGRGPVVKCKKCKTLCEVIDHREAA